MGNAIQATTSIGPVNLSVYVPLREALQRADALGVPVALRTSQHWASTRKVPSRRRDGKLEVALDDFIALARARAGADSGASETPPNGLGAVARVSAGATTDALAGGAGIARPAGAVADGAVAAEAFRRLEDGSSAIDLVQELHLRPDQAASLARSWREMRSVGEASATSRLAQLERQVEGLARQVDQVWAYLGTAREELMAMKDAVADVTRQANELGQAQRQLCDVGAALGLWSLAQ